MSSFETYLMINHERNELRGRAIKLAVCCSLASAVIAGSLGFGITYGVMKGKENKEEDNQASYVQTYNNEEQKDIIVNEKENIFEIVL